MTAFDLKAGQKVYLRDDLELEKEYGEESFEKGMLKGRYVTVLEIVSDSEFLIKERTDYEKITPPRFIYTLEMIDKSQPIITIAL